MTVGQQDVVHLYVFSLSRGQGIAGQKGIDHDPRF
jgi:hypothetical protein